jgi:hypothetical protein
MRKHLLPLLLAAAVSLAVLPGRAEASSVTISFFFDELSPHGSWVSAGSYGRCWHPRGVHRDWQPYLNGEWVYTDEGWTWVSYDPWGGDPYHYGTWTFSRAYGWIWIPGTIWAPAWVTWYVGDENIGWAPVPPSFSIGASGYSGSPITVSRSSYVFVPATQFAGVNAGTVRVPVAQNSRLLARTKPVTRFALAGGILTSGGPTIAQVERASQRKISRVGAGDAHTKAVAFDAGRRGGRSTVIAPAGERAKLIAPAKHEETRASHEKTRAHASSAPAERRTAPREQAAPARERTERPAAPVRERREAPAPRVQTADPSHGHGAAVNSPPAERHDAPAPRVQGEGHKPDSPPPQGGKAHEPKNEHGHGKE